MTQEIKESGWTRILRLFHTALSLLLATALLCGIYLMGAQILTGKNHPGIFGYSTAVVVSGSMTGTIEIDDMVIVRRQENYRVGDIITYESGSTTVTHRIVDQNADGFLTKGDTNNTPDTAPVAPERIVGRVVAVIPGVGRFIGKLQSLPGILCLVAAGIIMTVLSNIPERKKDGR